MRLRFAQGELRLTRPAAAAPCCCRVGGFSPACRVSKPMHALLPAIPGWIAHGKAQATPPKDHGRSLGRLCPAAALAAPRLRHLLRLLGGSHRQLHVLRGAHRLALGRRRHEGPRTTARAPDRPGGRVQLNLLAVLCAALPRGRAQRVPSRLRDHRARDAAADRRLEVAEGRGGLALRSGGRLHHAVEGYPPRGASPDRHYLPLGELLGRRLVLCLQVERNLACELGVAGQHVLEVILEVAEDLAQAVPELPKEGRVSRLHKVLQLDKHRHDVLAHVPLQDAAQHAPRRLGARLIAAALGLAILILACPLGGEADPHLLAAQKGKAVAQGLASRLRNGAWQLDLLLCIEEGCEERGDQLCTDVELLVVGHEREHVAVDHGTARGRPLKREVLVAGCTLEIGESGPAVQSADDVQEALGEHRGVADVQDPREDALDEAPHWLGRVAEHVEEAEQDGPSQLDEVLRQQGRKDHGSLLPQELVGVPQQPGHVGHEAIDERGVVDAEVPEGNEHIVPDHEGLVAVQVKDQQLHALLCKGVLLKAELPQRRECLAARCGVGVHALAVPEDGIRGDGLHLHDDALRDEGHVHQRQFAQREERAAQRSRVDRLRRVRADVLAQHGLD
mmetsp:Transcript_36720/g.99344  ORF Transcript_36720/g.99344 Transcript_36720/m.99344 type:complete len:620 (+) Transcript_36720:175-2034(+)